VGLWDWFGAEHGRPTHARSRETNTWREVKPLKPYMRDGRATMLIGPERTMYLVGEILRPVLQYLHRSPARHNWQRIDTPVFVVITALPCHWGTLGGGGGLDTGLTRTQRHCCDIKTGCNLAESSIEAKDKKLFCQ
jgi:hypothetical protein